MEREIFLLRLSYWTAAIADLFIAILVLNPERMGLSEMAYPMGLMSAVAFSRAILLLFADRNPVERCWVLLPTIIVVILLLVTRMIFSLNGTIEFSLSFTLFGVVLITLLTYSYNCVRKIDGRKIDFIRKR